jgi:hypothetical protein
MNIIMAIDTISFGFREYQTFMTLPAIYCGMLTQQRHFGGIMIKRVY